ncbi:MAG: ferredoxin [Turicibacter sp.]
MKAHVNQDTCIGCELCTSVCPEVFQMNDDGKSEVIAAIVAPEHEGTCKDAKESCPVDAISVE